MTIGEQFFQIRFFLSLMLIFKNNFYEDSMNNYYIIFSLYEENDYEKM